MPQRLAPLPLLFLWALAGALLGIGLVATLPVGAAMILFGAFLATCVAGINRGRGLWALLIGFGLAPAAMLVRDVVAGPPLCPTPPAIMTGAYACGYTPPSHTYLALGFLAIALVGALIPLVSGIARARRSAVSRSATDTT